MSDTFESVRGFNAELSRLIADNARMKNEIRDGAVEKRASAELLAEVNRLQGQLRAAERKAEQARGDVVAAQINDRAQREHIQNLQVDLKNERDLRLKTEAQLHTVGEQLREADRQTKQPNKHEAA